MKFKIGQKVRIVQWKDMPQQIEDDFGINTKHIGEIGTIEKLCDLMDGETGYEGINLYNVLFDNPTDSQRNLFEQELESVVEVGEQLMLWDLWEE